MKPLYVITVVFNPRRFRSRYELYNQFADYATKSNAKLLTVEVAFGERSHCVTNNSNPWHLQLRTDCELWHKEKALNLGLQRLCQLDPDWGYVAWMDCDIQFSRTDWAEETVHLLQHYAILQMFGEARWLGPDYHTLFSAHSILRKYDETGIAEWGDNPGLVSIKDNKVKNDNIYDNAHHAVGKGHPGLAWAYRRFETERIGWLLDTCVNGSGDLHMAMCYANRAKEAIPLNVSSGYRNSILRYGELCDLNVKANIGYMPGSCNHYWHGKSSKRGYEERWKLLVKYQFDPYIDLITDTQGLYKWRGNKKGLEYETRKSLSNRNEDGIDV